MLNKRILLAKFGESGIHTSKFSASIRRLIEIELSVTCHVSQRAEILIAWVLFVFAFDSDRSSCGEYEPVGAKNEHRLLTEVS